MILEGVEVFVLRQVTTKVLWLAEGIEIGEDGIALDLTGVADTQVVRISEHRLHFLLHFVGAVLQIDAVAKGFGHLGLSVGSGQT